MKAALPLITLMLGAVGGAFGARYLNRDTEAKFLLLARQQAELVAEMRTVRERLESAPTLSGGTVDTAELARRIAAQIASADGQVAPPNPNLTPEQIKAAGVAREEAEALLQQALKRGAWLDEDAESLRRISSKLLPADRQQLERRLIAAVNGQVLALETQGPPF